VTWPVRLAAGSVGLRPLRQRDAGAWRQLRLSNATWLAPWEPTASQPGAVGMGFSQLVRSLTRDARAGRGLPFALTVDGDLVGQLSVSGITWGALRGAHIGYWIAEEMAGLGIVPTAVALASDYCFAELQLHRVEINIRPENLASLRVVEKLGFREEGVRQRFLHIDGAWRDHRSFALTAEEVPVGGLLAAWRARSLR
jgi:[ribosomal protein S5]-alanine N-acetyltransferase